MSGNTALDIIDRELARPVTRLRFADAALEAEFTAETLEQSRFHNRCTILLLTGIFDLFWLGEVRTSPEVLVLSAWLRLGVLTPLTAAFIVLDWRGRLTRWRGAGVPMLIFLPTLLAGIESLFVHSPAATPNFQATPLILLALLTCRVTVRQALTVMAGSVAVTALIILRADFIASALRPTLMLTELALAVTVMVFAARIELRERQVFLLNRQAAIGRDMLAAQNRELARLSTIDALTGLGNRRCFDEALAAAWADRAAQGKPVSLVMFDIDHFKPFNDAFGHQAGDECLCALTRAVADHVRVGDTLARYGGEEFAVILPGTSLEDGQLVAERLRQAVVSRAIPHPCVNGPGYVTVSLGVAAMAPPSGSPALLLEAADRCLYAAKHNGRNRVEVSDAPPGMQPASVI